MSLKLTYRQLHFTSIIHICRLKKKVLLFSKSITLFSHKEVLHLNLVFTCDRIEKHIFEEKQQLNLQTWHYLILVLQSCWPNYSTWINEDSAYVNQACVVLSGTIQQFQFQGTKPTGHSQEADLDHTSGNVILRWSLNKN